jgi:hypothetical protein
MYFLTVEQAHSEPFRNEYRYRIITSLAGFLVCAGIVVGSAFGAYRVWVEEGTWAGVAILSWIAFWFFLFAWMLYRVLRARLRPTNWLVRTQSKGILIKFRSPLNYHFEAETLAVVHIAYGDIEFARPHRVRQTVPGGTPGEEVMRLMKFAEFRMRDVERVKELERRLSAERNREGPTTGRFIKTRHKSRHYPLQVSSEGFVRIEWFVRPSLKKFMTDIARDVALKEPTRSRKDFRNLRNVPVEEQETALLELIASGDRMSALEAVKELYGYDTTRAVKFVDELDGKKSGSHR